MRKILPLVLLLSGLFLLCYPTISQAHSAAAHTQAISEDPSVIGTLRIPSLDLTLPIRKGTAREVLNAGLGLLEGTDPTQHGVLCGHRGLPESRLFRDLDQLKSGDTFCVTIGDIPLWYRVDQIRTVLPEDTNDLTPVPGMQLCTLLTCTPYGINSHRLLVRGTRINRSS